jgi:4-oxalocrotonate tautomerase
MPTITVEGPPIKDLDRKRALTGEITDAVEKAYGLPKQALTVVIKENPPENVSVGGELLCDLIERRRSGEGGG